MVYNAGRRRELAGWLAAVGRGAASMSTNCENDGGDMCAVP